MYASKSIISALFAREKGQIESENIEVSMLDAAISATTVRSGYTFGTDEPFPRHGTHHPTSAPFGVFECEDESIVIAAGTESLWKKCCQALDRKDLLDDERFDTIGSRVENQKKLREEIESVTKTKPRDHWVEKMHKNGVPAGPIYDTKSIWNDEHVEQRGLRVTMERKDRDDAEVIDFPVRFANMEPSFRIPPQELGESTEDVLERYGYSEEEIEEFREDSVIG
jgi:crotonobetainyl-CoA:carnitine CoA-transferase CaiB-like acyl-CoA transferase